MRYVLFVIFVSFFSLQAAAITWEENSTPATLNKSKSAIINQTSKGGPYAVLEWNPADSVFNRVHVSGEYVIIDGFAFGGIAEFQQQDKSEWRYSTLALGATATQYLESQSLKGTYVKGELNAFSTQFNTKQKNDMDQYLTGIGLGFDLGYRFLIGQNFTGGASYGVRIKVPNFFAANDNDARKGYATRARAWDFRVQVNLGLAL